MAILISKQKAQSKGAMTIKPFANSTFTEGLFYLEDTMTTELSKKNYSRKKARIFWKQTYSDLPKDVVVHHKNGDPFNNNPDNLTIMENGKHVSYHALRIPNWGKRVNNITLLKRLEKALTIFNDR